MASPRTCRRRACGHPAARMTSGPRGVGRWTRRPVRSCAAACLQRGPVPSEGEPHRDHRASRAGISEPGNRHDRPRNRRSRNGRSRSRRSRYRDPADPDRADRRPPRRRPGPGRRRHVARPVRPGGRGGTARAGHGGGRRPHLRGPRLLPARRPAADDQHRRRGRLPGRHELHRVRRRGPPRGPHRGPHRRVRDAARGPPGRADRHRGRRPLRLLRPAHPVQPLPAPAPDHPQGHRDPPALHAPGRGRPRRGRQRPRPGRGRRALPPDEPPGLPPVLPHALQLRYAAPPDVVLLPPRLPAGRAGLHLRPLPPGGPPLETRRRHRAVVLPYPQPGFADPRHQRPLERHRPVPEDAGRLGRRGEPGRPAQGCRRGVPGDLALRHRGVPGAAGQHR